MDKFEDFTDKVPEEFTGFVEEEPVKDSTLGEFTYLKNLTSLATGEPAKLGEVDFDSTVRDAFRKVAQENNALDAEVAQRQAQLGNAGSVLASLESIRLRNMQVEGEYNNRIKELQEVSLAAAEKTLAASPKVILNNTPEKVAETADTAKTSATFNALMDMIQKKASNKLGIAGMFAWAFTPVSIAENYNIAQYVNSLQGEGTVNNWTTFSHESMQHLKAYYSALSDDEKESFIENTYKYFKDTWATTDTGAANIVLQMLEDEDPTKLEAFLSNLGGYAAPLAALGTAARVLGGARNVSSAMKMASVEKQLAEVGAKDAVVANASRNLGMLGAGQIVGGVTGVSDIVDTAKFVTMTSAKILPSSITTAASGLQDVVKAKVDTLVKDLTTTIKAQNIRAGEEVTLLKNIQERYNPAYNKEVHSFHPSGVDGGPPVVLYKPADETAFLTREAAEEALKAKDPKGLLGMRVVADTTNSGYQVPEAVLQARKARRDQLEVEYVKLKAQAAKVADKAETMSKVVPSPKSLVDAKPRYKTFPLKFASDVDKAIYQLGSKTAASKSDPEVFAFIKETMGFKTDKGAQAFITNQRKVIADYLKATTKNLDSGEVSVPTFKATSADTPKAKADNIQKDIEEVSKEISFLDEQIGAMNSANKGIVQGWLVEQRVDASPLYRNLGAYTEDDVNNMVRFSFGDWALGTSAELYANRVVGLMQSSRYQKLLTDFVRKPLESLNKKQRIQLNDVLVNGDKQGKEFDDAVLSLMGLDEKTREAYHIVRSLRNAMYTMRNNAAVQSLTGKGFKQLAMPLTLDEPGVMFGRVVNPQETMVRSVYNTGKQEASTIDDAVKGQQIVYELWQPVSIGGKEYRHIAINPSIVKESPIAQVIPYRVGEFKRSYTDGYFIKIRVKREIDGVVEETPITHRTAGTKTDADNYVKAFNEMVEAHKAGKLTLAKAAKMQAYGWKPEDLIQEISTGKYNDAKMEVLFNRTEDDYLDSMRNTGGSGFSQHRGEHIKDVYGNDTNTLSPIDSLAAEISNTSFMVPMTEWRDVAIHRWYNTVKDVLPVEAQNMPAEKAFYYMVNQKGTYTGSNHRNLFAQRVQDYVMNEVSVVTKEEELFASRMRYVAEKLEGATNGALPITGAALRMADVPTFMRAVAFHGFLGGGNPVQLVMQGLNAVNAAMISPVHGMKAAKNAVALRVALMSDREEVWRAVAATQKGVTLGLTDADEFVETVRALRRSGLLDGINSTSMYGAEVGKYGLFNKTTRVGGEASAFFFNRGEELSRIVSFDVARREFQAANKGVDWTTDAALAKIIERQDDLTSNMTNANRANWQQGLMSIPTQFMQYTVKFTLNLAYSGMGNTNRVFTRAEASRLLLGHMLFFGVAGNLGVSGLSWAQEMFGEAAKDWSENERLALQQGVVAAAINTIALETTGEDLQLAFGKRFGTLGSVNNAFSTTVDFILGDAKAIDFRDLLFGASGGALDRIFGNTADAVKLFYHNKDEITGDVLVEGMKLLATGGFSSLNNMQKAYIAEQNFNRIMSKSGTPLYYANENELAALRLGFTLNGEYEYSKLFKSAQDRKKHFADIAKEIGRYQALALTAKRAGNMDAYKGYYNVIQTILNAHENPLERRQLLEQMHKTWAGSKQRELLMQEMTSMDKKTTLLVEDGKEMVR